MPLTRDQERALWAYKAVAEVEAKPPSERDEYKTAVHAFGAEILRSGLAAAMAGLERRKDDADLLREHLVLTGTFGQAPAWDNNAAARQADATALPGRVRALLLEQYIFATRETLARVRWLVRAVQARFPDRE